MNHNLQNYVPQSPESIKKYNFEYNDLQENTFNKRYKSERISIKIVTIFGNVRNKSFNLQIWHIYII